MVIVIDEAKQKTAFSPSMGCSMQYVVIPFGLDRAPVNSQRLMDLNLLQHHNNVISGMYWKSHPCEVQAVLNSISNHTPRKECFEVPDT